MVTNKIRRRLTAVRTFKPLLRFRVWYLPIFIAVLVVAGWWMRTSLEKSIKARLADGLTTILEADITALEVWLDEQQTTVSLLAGSDHVRQPVLALEDSWSQNSGDAAGIIASSALAGLREYLVPLCQEHGYPGFAVITPDGTIIASERDESIGRRIATERIAVLARVLAGEAFASHPFIAAAPMPDENGVLREGMPIMIVAGPVRDDRKRVMAILALRIDPEKDFTRILQTARVQESGETYAFDAQGMLLSHSRFDDQLRKIGLIPDVPGSEALLTLQIRDPGGNLFEGHRAGAERGAQPLTRMAASAVTGQSGVDVEGYRDYRGVEVVGAWTWLDAYGLGVATEMDLAEAMAMPGHLRKFFWIVLGGFVLTSGLILLGTVFISRMGRQMNDAVMEARKLGQYTLEKKIGEGGMGQVYRARHALLRRPTAIKLLLPDRAGKDDITRFEREVQITSELTHPNTIAIYDYGRTPDGVFYYAMEFLPGINLAGLVETGGPQPQGRVIHVLRQVCGSLEEAHRAGLIHRDIKPENVILCQRGGLHDVAKVLDFGIVKDLGGRADERLTTADGFFGTPLYISPEALNSPLRVDARADIYALGAVAYYLLTAQPLFEGKNLTEICGHHLNTRPTPPTQRTNNTIGDDLERLILACLEKDPELRPRSSRQLADMLGACAAAGEWTEEQARAWWVEHAEEIRTETEESGKSMPTGQTATIAVDPHDRASSTPTIRDPLS
jgi:serine/threonine protein kinase